ncbi:hypothetical protein ACLKMH_20760 [Psychromonas sp. KJ10-10]|uniref:hypothetical protein n=1 Tax=Psychromonas sp. KJ10-10 TaxID=3391823 RepID=UPI0039B5B219
MSKLIKWFALSVVAIYCVIFFWKSDLGASYECDEDVCIESGAETSVEGNVEGSVKKDVKTHTELSMAQVIYESISSDYPITMNYPETDLKIKIDKVEEVKNLLYLSGRYEKELEKATDTSEAVYERATLYLNMTKIAILNKQSQDVVFYSCAFCNK